MKLNEAEIYEVFVVELPKKEHDRFDVVEAKKKEISNLETFEVFERVQDESQPRISTRWVVTESEDHDGQKTKIKARLVAHGYKEEIKQQSDSPTAQRESARMLWLISTVMKIEQIRSIDISAAFLQSDTLIREFWLQVKTILEENGYEKILAVLSTGATE